MGTLFYFDRTFGLSDQLLFRLDCVLAACHREQLSFQLHVTLGGEHDHDLISLPAGHGSPIMLKYMNASHELDYGQVVACAEKVRNTGMLTLTDLMDD